MQQPGMVSKMAAVVAAGPLAGINVMEFGGIQGPATWEDSRAPWVKMQRR
jgi:hypothetical protein